MNNELKNVYEVNDKKTATELIKGFENMPSMQFFAVPSEVTKKCSPEASILYGYILGFSNNLYRGSNTALASLMRCSTRTISRLLNELKDNDCIYIVIVNRTTRLVYPRYTLPFILDIESEPKRKKLSDYDKPSKVKNNPFDLPNSGFRDLMDENIKGHSDDDKNLPF